jgi:hypothetical protein
VSKAPFQAFTPEPLQLSSTLAAGPAAIGHDRLALLRGLISPNILVLPLRLGNVAAIGCVLTEVRECADTVITLIGHGIVNLLLATRLTLIDLRVMEAVFQRGGVMMIRRLDLGR